MIWNADPVAITILNLDIRWYGLVYAAGFLFSEWFGWHRIKETSNLTRQQWESCVLGIFFFGVLGGRLGEFVFFSPEVLIADPLEFFQIWHGGMSIQGGLIGAITWCWYWSRKHKINPLLITDALTLPLAIVLIFGRWANWMNGELWGRPTLAEWGVIFPHVDEVLRHPSQLYESAKNALLTLILIIFGTQGAQKKIGLQTAILITGYGILRFIIEFVRESDIVLIGLTTGQLLSLAMITGGSILAYKLNFWRK